MQPRLLSRHTNSKVRSLETFPVSGDSRTVRGGTAANRNLQQSVLRSVAVPTRGQSGIYVQAPTRSSSRECKQFETFSEGRGLYCCRWAVRVSEGSEGRDRGAGPWGGGPPHALESPPPETSGC